MTVLPPDPYKALGVSKDAQISEIRSAHRKLVLKCHPDKVQDPALKAIKQDEFQKVQQAYELLSDERERRKYDDQVKLIELRKQFQTKANISTPRSPPKEYNIYPAEPTEPIGRSPPPKGHSYSRSWEDELGRGPRIFDAAPPRSSRRDREGSYSDRPSKREVERERERDREARERDKDRERRRKAEDARRAEKEAKDQRRADKNKREKQRDKEIRRETDEKKRYTKPYIECFDDDIPPSKSDKKKSSSSKKYEKYEEKRDRSSSQEETPSPSQRPRPVAMTAAFAYAESYINRAKHAGPPALQRSKTYDPRDFQPPAPTPPPVTSSASPFATPDEDVRRSSARPRREAGDSPRLSRDKSFRTSSREMVDEPLIMDASPSTRHSAQFSKPTAAPPSVPSSPPRRDFSRTSSMPIDSGHTVRPVPPSVMRSQSYNVYPDTTPRGRERSRMHAQIEEESDSDDVYDRHARDHDRKYRSTRQYRSPEPETTRYHAKSHSFSRRLDVEGDPRRHYSTATGVPVVESRPPPPGRQNSYSSGMKFPKVNTSKVYGYSDVKYSDYYEKPYREGYVAYA